jgi:hypothetical protein
MRRVGGRGYCSVLVVVVGMSHANSFPMQRDIEGLQLCRLHQWPADISSWYCCLVGQKYAFRIIRLITRIYSKLSITVAARSKVQTVFVRSKIRIVSSNPTQGMDVCVSVFVLYCV